MLLINLMQALVTNRPEATTALLMQLCTSLEPDAKDPWVAPAADFAHLYDERQALLLKVFYAHSIPAAGLGSNAAFF